MIVKRKYLVWIKKCWNWIKNPIINNKNKMKKIVSPKQYLLFKVIKKIWFVSRVKKKINSRSVKNGIRERNKIVKARFGSRVTWNKITLKLRTSVDAPCPARVTYVLSCRRNANFHSTALSRAVRSHLEIQASSASSSKSAVLLRNFSLWRICANANSKRYFHHTTPALHARGRYNRESPPDFHELLINLPKSFHKVHLGFNFLLWKVLHQAKRPLE